MMGEGEVTETATTDMALAREAARVTELLTAKRLTRVMRPDPATVVLEFEDGARLFVDTRAGVELSVTGPEV